VKKFWLACFAITLWAQQPESGRALLAGRELLDSYERVIQLMESTTVSVPELARAGAPLIENERQAFTNVRANPADAASNYAFLTNLRAYLALSDAVAKPFPFSAEQQKQFNDLRDALVRTESHFHALIELKDRQLRNPDRDNLARYGEMDTRTAPPQSAKPRVVFLGDSITDGWRLNEYYADRDFINRGISGQITVQMLGRMESDVIKLKPAIVLVLAGTNDIARGVPVSTIEDNMTAIADLADFHQIKVILASVLPVSDYHKDVNPNYEMTKTRPPATIRALNEWMMSFCARRDFTYLDYYSQMVDAEGYLKTDIADDGLHPNSLGYRIMAPLALAAIDKVIGAAPAPKPKKHRLFGN
jgi:lysophospholipase L1-like esterase